MRFLHSGYKEGSLTTHTISLEMALEKFNQDKDQKLDLVFFKDAVQHIARLTRVLVSVVMRFTCVTYEVELCKVIKFNVKSYASLLDDMEPIYRTIIKFCHRLCLIDSSAAKSFK